MKLICCSFPLSFFSHAVFHPICLQFCDPGVQAGPSCTVLSFRMVSGVTQLHSAANWAGLEDAQRHQAVSHASLLLWVSHVSSHVAYLSLPVGRSGSLVGGCVKTGGLLDPSQLTVQVLRPDYSPFSHLLCLLRTLSFLRRLSSRLREKMLGHWPSQPR